MPKFVRQNFKGELTGKILYHELFGLLNSYTPRTLMQTEIVQFNETIESISKDFENVEGGNFKETFDKIVDKLTERDPHYQKPNLDFMIKV